MSKPEPVRFNSILPLNKHILVTASELDTTTNYGIIVSSGLGESRSAIVVEVGPDVKMVKPGYTLFIMWTKALPVNIHGNSFYFISEDDVVAIYDKV